MRQRLNSSGHFSVSHMFRSTSKIMVGLILLINLRSSFVISSKPGALLRFRVDILAIADLISPSVNGSSKLSLEGVFTGGW